VAIAVRPLAARDAGPAADVLFVAATARAARTGGVPAFDVPAEARRFVERLLVVDPMGAQVVDDDGEVIGVGWTHGRGRIATLGPLAVLPRRRGQGIGRQLLDACVASLGERGVQLRLVENAADAPSVAFYLRCGFRVVGALLEMERLADAGTSVAPPPGGAAIRAGTDADEAELVARDARSWGGPRPQDLAPLLERGQAMLLVRHDRVLAHGFARREERTTWIGPAAGDDGSLVASVVGHLAAEAVAGDGLASRVLVPAADRKLVDGVLAHGFTVRGTQLYLGAGGGTAPPPGYVLCSPWLA
jgi:ribosomal protein S18 acetylase RimI-like enzyme